MSDRKLTPLQIQELFAFCKKKGVRHYDLQIELVDHMASAIEHRWEENQDITFAEALPSTYRQFGVNGFSKFQEIKEKTLRKKYTRLLWQYTGEFYRLPKIIITIAISLSLFTAIRLSSNIIPLFSLLLLGIYTSLLLVYFLFFYKSKSQLELTTDKSFLIIDYLKSIRSSFLAVGFVPFELLPITSIIHREFQDLPRAVYFVELTTSFLIILFVYSMVAMFFYIPRRVKEDFLHDFPQFVKS
jgi:hypothetical protein